MFSKKLIVIRGLPGAGKSTIAKKVYVPKGYKHFEADQYFVDSDGVYKYDPSAIADAHEWCKDQVVIALSEGHRVVVSNTFTRKWEVKVLLEGLPINKQRDVCVLVAHGGAGNDKGIHVDKVVKMASRWQDMYGEINVQLDSLNSTRLIKRR